MGLPYYVSPEQFMKDKSDYARKGIARGKSVIAIDYAGGILLVAENPSKSLHKISEIYDRIAFAGVGKFNEFETLRMHGVRRADVQDVDVFSGEERREIVVCAPCAERLCALRCPAAHSRKLDADRKSIVRTRMFVTDISRWQEYGRAHGEFFAGCPPTTTMVEVKALIDPRMLIEIEADAILPPGA